MPWLKLENLIVCRVQVENAAPLICPLYENAPPPMDFGHHPH